MPRISPSTRGKGHWTSTKPELLARGDAHRSHTHPESCPRGEDVNTAVLTEDAVREIRAAYDEGETERSLSDRYGINKSSINRVVHRKSWRHVL